MRFTKEPLYPLRYPEGALPDEITQSKIELVRCRLAERLYLCWVLGCYVEWIW